MLTIVKADISSYYNTAFRSKVQFGNGEYDRRAGSLLGL
jgi:hypothetical protein